MHPRAPFGNELDQTAADRALFTIIFSRKHLDGVPGVRTSHRKIEKPVKVVRDQENAHVALVALPVSDGDGALYAEISGIEAKAAARFYVRAW
jgi:hypothetical protein